LIDKAFEDAKIKTKTSISWLNSTKSSWLRYSYEKNLSGEELYEYVRNAIELMKKYYPKYYLAGFTPEGYEVVKKAEEYELSKAVKRIWSEVENPPVLTKDVIEEWIKMAENGWDYDLIAIYYTLKAGKKYVPIFSYFLGEEPELWLSEETKEVVKEVSQEEGVEEETLEEEVKSLFLRRAEEWVKKARKDAKDTVAFLDYFDGEKIKVAVAWSTGVVYAEKKDWEEVRERLKEEVRELAIKLDKDNNLRLGR